MPSEKDLHDEFGLARETVRRAVAVLRTEGLIEVRPGRGTFVAEPPGRIELRPGDSAVSVAALTVTRAGGATETYPAGTTLAVHPPVAAAVIIHDGRVLMVRRRVAEGPLSWQFPAGKIEPGESPGEAAVRETREETALTVRVTAHLGERLHPHTGRTMLYFACHVIGGRACVADAEELAEVAWCDRATLTAHVPEPLHGPVQAYLDTHLR
jgi:mutator protein MutT